MKGDLTWHEDGEQKHGKEYPKGKYKFVDGLFTRISKEDPAWDSITQERERAERAKSGIQVITDSIEVKSHHDGKVYSSKHKYYQSLKDSGHHVVERGEEYLSRKKIDGDFDCRKELKEAARRHLGI